MTRALSEFRGVLFDADEIILVEPVYGHLMLDRTMIHSFRISFSQGSTQAFAFDSKEEAEFERVMFVDKFCRRK